MSADEIQAAAAAYEAALKAGVREYKARAKYDDPAVAEAYGVLVAAVRGADVTRTALRQLSGMYATAAFDELVSDAGLGVAKPGRPRKDEGKVNGRWPAFTVSLHPSENAFTISPRGAGEPSVVRVESFQYWVESGPKREDYDADLGAQFHRCMHDTARVVRTNNGL